MDPSRVLLALQEQTKWRERRKRMEERIRQIQSRKRYFLKELDVARQKVAQFGALLAQRSWTSPARRSRSSARSSPS